MAQPRTQGIKKENWFTRLLTCRFFDPDEGVTSFECTWGSKFQVARLLLELLQFVETWKKANP